MQERLMREALAEAERGMAEGEAPIGCVLATGSGPDLRVVARGHNRQNALGRKMAHAEMVAFENAGSRDGQPPALPLDAQDVTLVSTLEPCVMYLGAAMEAGVARVLFGLEAPADNGTQRVKPPKARKAAPRPSPAASCRGKAAPCSSAGWRAKRVWSKPNSWNNSWP